MGAAVPATVAQLSGMAAAMSSRIHSRDPWDPSLRIAAHLGPGVLRSDTEIRTLAALLWLRLHGARIASFWL